MGTITAYFTPINITVAGQTFALPDNHVTIVWTDDEGQSTYYRGGPSAGAGFGSDGGGSGSSGISSGGDGSNFPFGSVYAQSGVWAPPPAGQTGSTSQYTSDYQPPGGAANAPPPQILLTGSDSQLAPDSSYIQNTLIPQIISSDVAYNPAGINSNSVAGQVLNAFGAPAPSGTDLLGANPAPGFGLPVQTQSTGTILGEDLSVASSIIVNGFDSLSTAVTSEISKIASSIFGVASAVVDTGQGTAETNGISSTQNSLGTDYNFSTEGQNYNATINNDALQLTNFGNNGNEYANIFGSYQTVSTSDMDSANVINLFGPGYNTISLTSNNNVNLFSGSNDFFTTNGSGDIFNAPGAVSDISVQLDSSNLNFTDNLSGLIVEASGGSQSNSSADFGSGTASLTDDMNGSFSIYDSSGVSGGKATFGLSYATMDDSASGSDINNADDVFRTTTDFSADISSSFQGSEDFEHVGTGDDLTSGGNADDLTGSGAQLNVYGKDNDIDVNSSDVTVYGSDTGDDYGGSGNSYSYEGDGGDGDGTYGDGGDGYEGDGVGDGDGDGLGDGDGYGDGVGDGDGDGVQQVSRAGGSRTSGSNSVSTVTTGAIGAASTKTGAAHVQPVTVSSAISTTPSVEGPTWRGEVVTYSFSATAGQALNAAEQAAVERAFGAWAQASGLVFEQVANPAQADISVGFAPTGTLAAGILGQTIYASSTDPQNNDFFTPGASIQLAVPDQAAPVAGAAGALASSGAESQLYQVALNEIGHALGLASDDDPDSIMYSGGLGTANQQLDATDVAGIRQLYGQVEGVGDANTYTYNSGAGPVVIDQLDTAADPDNVLKFASGITPGEVGVSTDPNGDVLLTLSGGGQVTLAHELDSTTGQAYGVQAIDFADGTSWNETDLLAKVANSLPGNTGFSTDLGQLVQSIASFEADSAPAGATTLDPSSPATTSMAAFSTLTAAGMAGLHKAA